MLTQEIRRWLERYLSEEVSLAAFEDWFLPATWNLAGDDSLAGDDKVSALAADITLCLAEFDNGDRTEAEVNAYFAGLLQKNAALR